MTTSLNLSALELIARIKAILRRGKLQQQSSYSCIKLGKLLIDKNNYEVFVDGYAIRMTLTEFKILTILSSHPGKVFSRDQLLSQINDNHITVIDRNIDVHIRALRKKLGTEKELIQTVRGVGYKCQDKGNDMKVSRNREKELTNSLLY